MQNNQPNKQTTKRMRRLDYFFISQIIGLGFSLLFSFFFLNDPNFDPFALDKMLVGFILGAPIQCYLASRRLKDIDVNPNWAWLAFIPIVNFGLGLFVTFASGTVGDNRFGADPRLLPPKDSFWSWRVLTRGIYAMMSLSIIFISLVVFVGFSIPHDQELVGIFLATLWQALSLLLMFITVRRLMDTGWSLWWTVLMLIPFVNAVLVLILFFIPSKTVKTTHFYS
ncbi:DUF805 domain-containing protein [Moraxella sp. ZJ142]|uniref:DUF805 domain-containing protein n=1 Tax=Moraxella marmotae TaxID=3344520 RepID=UPI0035D4016C